MPIFPFGSSAGWMMPCMASYFAMFSWRAVTTRLMCPGLRMIRETTVPAASNQEEIEQELLLRVRDDHVVRIRAAS